MNNIIIIAAKAASGKTEFIHLLEEYLRDHEFQAGYITDRLALQGHVIDDATHFLSRSDAQRIYQSNKAHTAQWGRDIVTVSNFVDSEEVIHGSGHHSDFAAFPSPYTNSTGIDLFKRMLIHLHDGTLLNNAHRDMMRGIGTFAKQMKGTKNVLLVEWATGPDGFTHLGDPELIIHQSVSDLVRMLYREELLNDVSLVFIESPFEVRAERNRRRLVDMMTDEEFALIFPDGGEPTAEDIRFLGNNYVEFPNLGMDRVVFDYEANNLITKQIFPRWFEGSISQESSAQILRRKEG